VNTQCRLAGAGEAIVQGLAGTVHLCDERVCRGNAAGHGGERRCGQGQ
jgi:hypothetical protein